MSINSLPPIYAGLWMRLIAGLTDWCVAVSGFLLLGLMTITVVIVMVPIEGENLATVLNRYYSTGLDQQGESIGAYIVVFLVIKLYLILLGTMMHLDPVISPLPIEGIEASYSISMVFLLVIFSILALWILTYPVWAEISKKQATLGKRLLSCYVVTGHNQSLGPVRALLRYWLILLIIYVPIPFTLVIDMGWILISKDKKALHDYVFDTKVVLGEADKPL